MTNPSGKVLQALRQRYCRHLFKGVDLRLRSEDGKVSWACSRCGKSYRLDYGLQAPGKIVGPWVKPAPGRQC